MGHDIKHWQFFLDLIASGVSAAEFAAFCPEEIETRHLQLHPACHLLQFEWPTVALWQAHQAGSGQPFPQMERADTWALVVRPLWQAQVLASSRAGHAALSALARGQDFGAALDAAFDIDEAFDVAAHLQQWMAHAVLVVPAP